MSSTLAAVLVGCAVQAPLIDPAARAPRLDGFGVQRFEMRSADAEARRLFAEGVAQAYAFNEAEAVRMFKAALARDPDCTMCAWGMAWQLGPNINAPGRRDQPDARRYAALALKGVDRATPRERALIEAMALRYGETPVPATMAPVVAEVCSRAAKERPDPLDVAYAERLYELVQRTPDDPDLLSLWAEAEMVATRDDWWDAAGKPARRIGELADRVEAALRKHPDHTGLNHYMVHAVDTAGAQARRAVPAADRLGVVAPKSPHLVHMPSHIYVRVGRYADATRVNEQAIALDVAMAADLKAQGFTVSKDWRGHNTAFAWFGALMEGRGDAALALARQRAERARASTHVFGEYQRAMPVLTLLRLERWEALLAEPATTGDKGMAAALDGHARGLALLRLGRIDEARARLKTVEAAAQQVVAAHGKDTDDDRAVRGMAEWAMHTLKGELAFVDRQGDVAVGELVKAREAARPVNEGEPPMLGAGTVAALADMQLRTGHAAEAEALYREDLKTWPGSGWALRGLRRAQEARGQSALAANTGAELATHWPQADAALRR